MVCVFADASTGRQTAEALSARATEGVFFAGAAIEALAERSQIGESRSGDGVALGFQVRLDVRAVAAAWLAKAATFDACFGLVIEDEPRPALASAFSVGADGLAARLIFGSTINGALGFFQIDIAAEARVTKARSSFRSSFRSRS